MFSLAFIGEETEMNKHQNLVLYNEVYLVRQAWNYSFSAMHELAWKTQINWLR